MHNALVDISQRVDANSKLFGVGAKGFNLSSAGWVGNWLVDVESRCVVILGGDGQVRASNWAAGKAKAIESLRASYLVN